MQHRNNTVIPIALNRWSLCTGQLDQDLKIDNSQLEEVGEVSEVRRELTGEVLPLEESAKIIMVPNRAMRFCWFSESKKTAANANLKKGVCVCVWTSEAYISVTWQTVPLEKEQSQCTPESPWSQGPAPAVKSQLDTPSLAAIRRRTLAARGGGSSSCVSRRERGGSIKTNFWVVAVAGSSMRSILRHLHGWFAAETLNIQPNGTFCFKETVSWRFSLAGVTATR